MDNIASFVMKTCLLFIVFAKIRTVHGCNNTQCKVTLYKLIVAMVVVDLYGTRTVPRYVTRLSINSTVRAYV